MALPQPWLDIPADSDFSIHNLPYGVFSESAGRKRLGVAIGDAVIDLAGLAELGQLSDWSGDVRVFEREYLNDFIRLTRGCRNDLRLRLQNLLTSSESAISSQVRRCLLTQLDVVMHLPVNVGDYTDFYSSLEHATHVGQLFRPEQPLMPNWRHLPIAYHGRASTVNISGTPVRRPSGQVWNEASGMPELKPTKELDFELEMAMVISRDSEPGIPVKMENAEDYIFGFALFNDWSARDIQRWEYRPLGPFTSKNFASSISPWIVPLEALMNCRVPGPVQIPEPLPYLQSKGNRNFDIQLSITLSRAGKAEKQLTSTNAKYLYWDTRQQIVQHTISGCQLRVGDLLATGTISGDTPGSSGCLLEHTEGGRKSWEWDGEMHTFLENGDVVHMSGFAGPEGGRIGFGEVSGRIFEAE